MEYQLGESLIGSKAAINELREKINNLQREVKHLKERETAPTDSLFQEDLNKIKTGMEFFSDAIQNTNDLFESSDKKNTDISNELKTLKREVNKRFEEEKDLGKRRHELLDFLNEGMGKLQNRTKQLVNEIKNVRDGLKEEHERVKAACSVTQSTKDLLKNSDKRITETSNEVKALEKEVKKCLSVRLESFNDNSIVKEEDLTKLRNGVLNIYSRGIQQVHEINKEMSNEIKNLHEVLKKQQEKVDNVVQSTASIKNQRSNLNEKQAMMENSIKQFSSEIKNLQSELKAEQKKNIILENKLMAHENHLQEILLRNDIKHNSNKEMCIDRTPVPNAFPKQPVFVPETCKLPISNPQTKEHGQMDMESKLLRHDIERIDIVRKVHFDANFREEVESKYVCEEVKQKDSEKECRVSLQQRAEVFHDKETSASSVYSQTDVLYENQCADLEFDSSSGKEGALSYLEKAHAYLQSLQMAEIFPLSNEETSAVSDNGSSVTCGLGNDARKDCGEGKKQKKKKKRKNKEIRDAILSDKIEWMIRANAKPVKDFTSKKSYQSRVFYTGTPGYRLQLCAKISRQEREIFFCLRVLKGVYDKDLEWPCQQAICVKLSEKMQPTGIEYWFIREKDVLKRPKSKKDKVHTKYLGPFSLSHDLISQDLIFDFWSKPS